MLRQKAISGFIELFKCRLENCVSAIKAGCVPPLFNLIVSDEDNSIREGALEALSYIATIKMGRDLLLTDSKALNILMDRVENDESENVQIIALRVLQKLGREAHGCKILSDNTVPLIIHTTKKSSNDIVRAEALRVLQRALYTEGCDGKSLECKVVPLLNSILSESNSSELLTMASDVLALICLNAPGMEESVKEESVYSLLPLLTNNSNTVRQSSVNCLAQITVAKLAKDQCVSSIGSLDSLKDMIRSRVESKQTKVNILRVITNLSEHPLARRFFLDLVPHMTLLRSQVDEEVRQYDDEGKNKRQEEEDSTVSPYQINMQLSDCLTICVYKVSWKP